jgi:hypothetical protein
MLALTSLLVRIGSIFDGTAEPVWIRDSSSAACENESFADIIALKWDSWAFNRTPLSPVRLKLTKEKSK